MLIIKEAMFYKNIDDYIKCELCPHYCRINKGKLGRCKVRKNIDGKLYSLNYGKLSAVNIDPIEKKPIYHFMPETLIYSIGSFGCNFKCGFCQNYSISMENPKTIDISPRNIVEKVIDAELPSISYTYNEPTVFYEMMFETAVLAKNNNINNVIVTNGYINKEPLEKILPYISAMNIDLKTYDDNNYRGIGGKEVKNILDTIEIASKVCHVEVTMLIVPNFNDDIEKLEKLFKRLKSIAPNIILHLTRYFPMYKYNEPATSIDLMLKAKEIADKYFNFVYLGNVR